MNGYQITFYTQQKRAHNHKPLADWLIDLAVELELSGATQVSATKGVGKHHHIHSANFFELADQPQTITMIVSIEESEKLFERLKDEKIELFYVKSPVEFGVLGKTECAGA